MRLASNTPNTERKRPPRQVQTHTHRGRKNLAKKREVGEQQKQWKKNLVASELSEGQHVADRQRREGPSQPHPEPPRPEAKATGGPPAARRPDARAKGQSPHNNQPTQLHQHRNYHPEVQVRTAQERGSRTNPSHKHKIAHGESREQDEAEEQPVDDATLRQGQDQRAPTRKHIRHKQSQVAESDRHDATSNAHGRTRQWPTAKQATNGISEAAARIGKPARASPIYQPRRVMQDIQHLQVRAKLAVRPIEARQRD